jgi:hypothetical protein
VNRRLSSLLIAITIGFPGIVRGQSPRHDYEPILEVGFAAEGGLSERAVGLGGTVALELTAVEHWLEFEAGVSLLRRDHATELGFDLLAKKPYRFSPTVEFMVGAGPTMTWEHELPNTRTVIGASAVLDLMLWPRAASRIGWYLEPGLDLGFHDGTTTSLGLSMGLLIRLQH